MPEWVSNVTAFLDARAGELWVWFDSLNRQEWLVVLACCCAAGFLCMRSMGRRGPC